MIVFFFVVVVYDYEGEACGCDHKLLIYEYRYITMIICHGIFTVTHFPLYSYRKHTNIYIFLKL